MNATERRREKNIVIACFGLPQNLTGGTKENHQTPHSKFGLRDENGNYKNTKLGATYSTDMFAEEFKAENQFPTKTDIIVTWKQCLTYEVS
jgi:hypothetical protein